MDWHLCAFACFVAGCTPPPPIASPVVAVPRPAPAASATTGAAERTSAPVDARAEVLQIKEGIPLFRGKVLHPGALHELGTSLADAAPIDLAVDLDGVQASNRYYRPAVVRDHYVDFKDDDILGKDASFTYVYLGTTPGGVLAFETYFSGGGSGTFMNVLLVRIEKVAQRRDEEIETRWRMARVGAIGLGDRALGEVTLAGGTLTVSASQYRPKPLVLKLE
jgi:hypothetical protein